MELENSVADWLTLNQASELLGVSGTRIRHLAREKEIIAVKTPNSREVRVPAECVRDGEILKGLGGTLILLGDSGFDEMEAAAWMYRQDDYLEGRPIDSLLGNRLKEVRRRIQMLTF